MATQSDSAARFAHAATRNQVRLRRKRALMMCGSICASIASAAPLLDQTSFDPATKPCNNFYEYAAGGWMATHPIPAALSSWRPATQVAEEHLAKMREALQTLIAAPASGQLLQSVHGRGTHRA